MSFTQAKYSVGEDEEVLTVSVERSGDSDSHVVVHVHSSEGTATGQCILSVHNNVFSCIFVVSSQMWSLHE